jgi:hypothetical protein
LPSLDFPLLRISNTNVSVPCVAHAATHGTGLDSTCWLNSRQFHSDPPLPTANPDIDPEPSLRVNLALNATEPDATALPLRKRRELGIGTSLPLSKWNPTTLPLPALMANSQASSVLNVNEPCDASGSTVPPLMSIDVHQGASRGWGHSGAP